MTPKKPTKRLQRPFLVTRQCLAPDLFLRGIPELIGTEREFLRKPREVFDQLNNRAGRAKEDIETLIQTGLHGLAGSTRIVPPNYAEYLAAVATTLPSYTAQQVEHELNRRKTEFVKDWPRDERGRTEYTVRKEEWKRALEDASAIAEWHRQEGNVKNNIFRVEMARLESEKLSLVYHAPRKSRSAPPSGEAVAVSWRIKTLESIARKSFRKIVGNMTAQEAKVIEQAIKKGASVKKLAQIFEPFLYNLEFEDTNGMKIVYATLDSKQRGVERFMDRLSGTNIRLAKLSNDKGGHPRESEDYSQPRKRKNRPYEATHKTIISPSGRPDFIEVHFDTLWGAITQNFGDTRSSHRFYEQKKKWQRTDKTGREWSDAHRFVYSQLFDYAMDAYGMFFPIAAK